MKHSQNFTFSQTLLSILFLVFSSLSVSAQIAQRAHPTAALEVDSTTKGFLPPRMSTAQRDAIPNPAKGLVIFNLNTDKFNYYDGTSWIVLAAGGNTALVDDDGDTKIQVEESADEDIIRFDVQGSEVVSMTTDGIYIEPWRDVTFQSGWVDYGADSGDQQWNTVQFRKDVFGTVYLKGLIRRLDTASSNILFILPADYRPSKSAIFSSANHFNEHDDIILVRSNGVVEMQGRAPGDSYSWISLDNIYFHTR